MIPPIPKKILNHSVIYEKYVEDSGEGNIYEKPIVLDYVRIEEQKQIIKTSNGIEIIGSATLYYDLVNSTGLSEKPVNESKVTFEDRTYIIMDTDILRANSKVPHHYEIKLK